MVGPNQKPTQSDAVRLYQKLREARSLSHGVRYKTKSPLFVESSTVDQGQRPLNPQDTHAVQRIRQLFKSSRKRFKVSHLNGSHGEYTESDDVKRHGNKKGSQKRPKNPPKKKNSSTSSVPRPVMTDPTCLSKCAAKFLLAQTAPFSADAIGACCPTVPARNTFRASCVVRGTVSTGTTGTGILIVTPCLGNDGAFVTATKPAFTGTADTFTILTATDVFAGGGISNWTVTPPNTLPYTLAALYSGHGQGAQQVFGRVVGGGLRLRPMSAPLYRQGVHFAFTDPTHANFTAGANGHNFSIQSSPYTRVFTSEDSIELCFGPIDPNEMTFPMEESGYHSVQTDNVYPLSLGRNEYSSSGFTWTRNSQKVGQPIIGILFTGASLTSPTVFEYEAIIHVEYAGPVADNFGLPTEPDQVGTIKVLNAVSQVQRAAQTSVKAVTGSKKAPSLTKLALNAMKTAAIEVAPHALSYLAKSLPTLLL